MPKIAWITMIAIVLSIVKLTMTANYTPRALQLGQNVRTTVSVALLLIQNDVKVT